MYKILFQFLTLLQYLLTIPLIRASLLSKNGVFFMNEEDMSQQVQDQINRLQQLRTSLQMIMQQNQQIEIRLKEVEEALEELDKTNAKTPIYKSIGSVLIKSNGKKEVINELKSTKESLDLRKDTLNKQEGRTREKLNELQSKVQNALKLKNKAEV